ncbi:MAG: hypothetical protein ACK5VX_20210, partial [Akkermansiaceae bacterium]
FTVIRILESSKRKVFGEPGQLHTGNDARGELLVTLLVSSQYGLIVRLFRKRPSHGRTLTLFPQT